MLTHSFGTSEPFPPLHHVTEKKYNHDIKSQSIKIKNIVWLHLPTSDFQPGRVAISRRILLSS